MFQTGKLILIPPQILSNVSKYYLHHIFLLALLIYIPWTNPTNLGKEVKNWTRSAYNQYLASTNVKWVRRTLQIKITKVRTFNTNLHSILSVLAKSRRLTCNEFASCCFLAFRKWVIDVYWKRVSIFDFENSSFLHEKRFLKNDSFFMRLFNLKIRNN